jgi:hypothetical protein
MASALPNINHNSSTMAEIRASLHAGKEVITHTDSVSVPGWSGAGYIIFDSEVGDGAYKISGGENGGWLYWWGLFLVLVVVALTVILLAVAAVLVGGVLGVILAGLALYNFFSFVDTLSNIDDPEEFNRLMALTIISQLVSLIPFSKLGAEGVSLAIFIEGFLAMWGLAWYG